MKELELQIPKCKQADCNISKDGKCLESLDKEECPHFYWADNESNEEESTELVQNEIKQDTFKLYPGEAVSISDLNTITYAYNCNKIVILGESESGKTTLLGYLFDKFQKGPYKDINFAGSLTLRGFDERCHYSRTSSNTDIPHTEKTIVEAFDFLHLALKKNVNDSSTHLLLSDISGEKLRDAGHSSILMADLEMLKYANKIIIVIDGKKIADKKLRQATLFSTQGFIQKALDDQIFNKKTDLQVVLSKWDHFVNDEEFNFEQLIVSRFTKLFEGRLGNLRFAKICASPKLNINQIEIGYGIYELLVDWMDSGSVESSAILQNKKMLHNSRYFLQFQC